MSDDPEPDVDEQPAFAPFPLHIPGQRARVVTVYDYRDPTWRTLPEFGGTPT